MSPREQHRVYMMGWKDGARGTAMIDTSESAEFTEIYGYGYRDGYDARQKASEEATYCYNHQPGMLRVQAEHKGG